MPAYDIRPLQLRILSILEAVDRTCREHKLRYYIWAGTMIGAVRHKGFIPWDDDLDIAMPRPDYDRLIAHQKEWLPEPFEMVCAENDTVYQEAMEYWTQDLRLVTITLKNGLQLRDCIYAPVPGTFSVYGDYKITEPFFS